MANQIDKNSYDRAILHLDTNDDSITLAELKSTNEATVVSAKIVEVFYEIVTSGSILIDRGGADALKITNPASSPTLVGNINYRQAGIVLRGDNTADIGVTLTGTGTRLTIVVHKTH